MNFKCNLCGLAIRSRFYFGFIMRYNEISVWSLHVLLWVLPPTIQRHLIGDSTLPVAVSVSVTGCLCVSAL